MDWIEECKIDAMKLKKEKRQQFIDLIWKNKTIGEARKECGITFNEASGIMTLNILNRPYLNTKSV